MTESDKSVMQQSLRFLIKSLQVAQGHAPCELYADAIKVADSMLQQITIAQPVQPQDLQKQLADLHQYEEIAEHYAKCAISPEALRDWVVTAQQPVVYAVNIDAATQTALDKAFTKWEIKLCTDAIKQGNVTIRKPLK